MIPYLITFSFTIVLTYCAERLLKNNKKIYSFLIMGICIFILSFLAGIRSTSVGKDIPVYVIPPFQWAQSMNFTDFIKVGNLEDGFMIFTYVITRIFNDHHFILFALQAIVSTIIYIFAYKNKDDISITLVIFTYLTIFYNDTLTMMRQSVAISFIIMSLISLKEKKYIKTIIFYVLAVSFHITALMAILIHIIIIIDNTHKIKKSSKFFINATIIVVFLLGTIAYQKILYILTYNIPILPVKFYEYLNSSYYNESGLSISKANLLFKTIWLFVAIYLSKLVKKEDINTYVKFIFIDFCIYIVSFKLPPIMRLGYYYTYPALLSIIPRTYKIFKDNKTNKVFVTVMLIIFLIAYWYFTHVLHGESGGTYPYSSDIITQIF